MPHLPGIFITGTDTDVGKTYVGSLIAASLAGQGHRVGVYKPAASGCRMENGELVSDDAVSLWEAAGKPGELSRVCPQCFAAPLAPHLAAREEGRRLDAELLRTGLDYWRSRSDVLLVEGAGGLMSPLGDEEYVADLATEFGFPLVVVCRNVLGTINQTLMTLFVAEGRYELDVSAIVLNHPSQSAIADASLPTNRRELSARCGVPIFAEVAFGGSGFDPPVDWIAISK